MMRIAWRSVVWLGIAVGGCTPPAPRIERSAEGLPLASSEEAQALAARVSEYLDPVVQNGEFSGIALIGTRDSILVLESRGRKSYPGGDSIDAGTRFVIASLTKTLTAGAILTLAEDGVLDLQDPLSRFAPGFPRAEEITIRLLLRHESGVGNPDYLKSFDQSRRSMTLGELVQEIAAQPFQFDPGTQGRYSNAGFNLLAYVIQQAGGVPYEEFLADRFFSPLQMIGSGQFSAADLPPDHAIGHLPGPPPGFRQKAPYNDFGFSIGSGALSSTAPDLWRWARAVADERSFSWRALEWPYGWGKVDVGPHSGIEQTGAITGFMSNLLVFPDADRFVVVLYNQEYGGWIPVGRDLAAIALGEPYESRRVRPVHAVPVEDLARLVGTYAADENRLRVRVEDGHLWLYSGDWPVGKYLAPTSDTTFVVPSDAGVIRFGELEEHGFFGSLTWDSGQGGTAYRRVR